jgi:hypothetical protein
MQSNELQTAQFAGSLRGQNAGGILNAWCVDWQDLVFEGVRS